MYTVPQMQGTLCTRPTYISLTINQSEQAVKSLPLHKAADLDGIELEHLLCASPFLLDHLCTSVFKSLKKNRLLLSSIIICHVDGFSLLEEEQFSQYKLPSLSSRHSYFKILYTLNFLMVTFIVSQVILIFVITQILERCIGNNYFFHLLDIALVSTPAQLKESSIIPDPHC